MFVHYFRFKITVQCLQQPLAVSVAVQKDPNNPPPPRMPLPSSDEELFIVFDLFIIFFFFVQSFIVFSYKR